ncbi:hypothetical protein IVA79_13205 [Bradyrhizobium sp. 138]|uniref:hypothetical protein n=1 Tax=Bradyrhizobium sp. 138 TaxID=2782615 RepID=UPI001FF905FB|nr:hypothetical protein [Bradyrhizobium sp. 138]MCK1734897.1 hypothetical protein [Bradyrhizobium sp. 138]
MFALCCPTPQSHFGINEKASFINDVSTVHGVVFAKSCRGHSADMISPAVSVILHRQANASRADPQLSLAFLFVVPTVAPRTNA